MATEQEYKSQIEVVTKELANLKSAQQQFAGQDTDYNRQQYAIYSNKINDVTAKLNKLQSDAYAELGQAKTEEISRWSQEYLKTAPTYKAEMTPFETVIQNILGERAQGKVAGVQPEDVTKWLPFMEQIFKPQEERGLKQIGQQFTDLGTYYSGGRTGEQARFTGEMATTKTVKALETAQTDWVNRQKLIETALSGGMEFGKEQERRRYKEYGAKYDPWELGYKTEAGLKGTGLEYAVSPYTKTYTPSYATTYKPEGDYWSNFGKSILEIMPYIALDLIAPGIGSLAGKGIGALGGLFKKSYSPGGVPIGSGGKIKTT